MAQLVAPLLVVPEIRVQTQISMNKFSEQTGQPHRRTTLRQMLDVK